MARCTRLPGTAGAATCLDVGRGHDRQVELGPVGELGEDPPDVLTVGSGAVPQYVDERPHLRQRCHHQRFRGPYPPGAGLATRGVDAERSVDVGQGVGRTAAQRALRDLEVAARTTPSEFSDTAATTARVKLWIEDLDDPAVGSEASGRLLAWLLARREG